VLNDFFKQLEATERVLVWIISGESYLALMYGYENTSLNGKQNSKKRIQTKLSKRAVSGTVFAAFTLLKLLARLYPDGFGKR